VNFDHRGLDALDRIVQRHAGVGIGAGIEQHRLGAHRLRFMEPVHQMAFVIRLAHVHAHPQFLRSVLQAAGNVVQRVVPIDLGFAHAQQVEIGPVEHEDDRGGSIGHDRVHLQPESVAG
jgi:hypothetical protein